MIPVEEERKVLDLTGSFTVEGTEAVVRYTGVNMAEEPILVAHVPSDVRFKVYPNAAYCSLSPDEQCVKLLLGDSPFPYDREVEFGVGAFFKLVPQGSQVTGELRLALPIQEWSGYFPPNKMIDTEIVRVRQVALHVAVVPQSAVRWMKPARIAPEYWSVEGPFITCVLRFDLDSALPVAKRSDNFPRP